MCCALTDGFGPGTAALSGLVQRGVIMPPVGGSRGAAIKLIARQGDTTPSEPFEPSEPSEPGPQSGPMSDTTTLGPEGPIKPKNPKNLLNPHAHRRVHQGVSKKDLQSMDFLCIIRTIIKHKARGPAYFGMQAFSILEVAVMILHYGEG